jgi:hypothetical protein
MKLNRYLVVTSNSMTRIFAPRPPVSASSSEFHTPTNAARRLLQVIHRIEQVPDESSSDSQPVQFHSPPSSQTFDSTSNHARMRSALDMTQIKIVLELAHIKQYVEALDQEYEILQMDYRLDL